MKIIPNSIFYKFLAFWLFLILFKFGAGLHYTMLSTLGEKVLPLWLVGILIGGGAFIQLILDVPAGYLADRYGYLKVLKITTFIFIITGLCLSFNFNYLTYIFSIILSTFGWLFFGPGVNAYTLSHAQEKTAGTFISFKDTFSSFGTVICTGILGLIIDSTPQTIGLIITITMIITLITLSFSPIDKNQPLQVNTSIHHQNHLRRNSFSKSLKALRSLNPASTMLLLLGLSSSIFYGIIWFILPLVIAHQNNSELLSLSLGVFDFAIVVLGYFLGKITDQGNKRTLVFFGLLIFSISAMLLSFNFNWLFLIFGLLATGGDELASLSLWSWLHSLDKNHQHDGLISGIISLSQDLGWTIGPIAAGLLYSSIGPSLTIALSAGLLFLVWLIYQLFIYKAHPINSLVNHPKPPRKRHRS